MWVQVIFIEFVITNIYKYETMLFGAVLKEDYLYHIQESDFIIDVSVVYLYVVVIQREQAEREQDWEQEQREKREALEAAQRELEEVLDSNSAWLGYSMISSYTNYMVVKVAVF